MTIALAKLGELLADLPKASGSKGRLGPGPGRGNKNGGTALAPPFSSAATYAELGLDKKAAAVAQQLVDVLVAAVALAALAVGTLVVYRFTYKV